MSKNKLWLLRPIDSESGPWDPWYDKAFGFVVVAPSEGEARAVTRDEAGEEVYDSPDDANPWEDPKLTTCEELTAGNESAHIVMRDFAAA